MPKAFSEEERATIRAQLLEKGREMLAVYGVRKTSVDDLVNAVGISKGAFYLFFNSKEEMFFQVLQDFENHYQTRLLTALGSSSLAPAERLIAFFQVAFFEWRNDPLFKRFSGEDYDLLMRRLPQELANAALKSDERFAARLLARWRAEGLALRIDAPELVGVLRALFLVTLHHGEFPDETFERVQARLLRAIAYDLAASV